MLNFAETCRMDRVNIIPQHQKQLESNALYTIYQHLNPQDKYNQTEIEKSIIKYTKQFNFEDYVCLLKDIETIRDNYFNNDIYLNTIIIIIEDNR